MIEQPLAKRFCKEPFSQDFFRASNRENEAIFGGIAAKRTPHFTGCSNPLDFSAGEWVHISYGSRP